MNHGSYLPSFSSDISSYGQMSNEGMQGIFPANIRTILALMNGTVQREVRDRKLHLRMRLVNLGAMSVTKCSIECAT